MCAILYAVFCFPSVCSDRETIHSSSFLACVKNTGTPPRAVTRPANACYTIAGNARISNHCLHLHRLSPVRFFAQGLRKAVPDLPVPWVDTSMVAVRCHDQHGFASGAAAAGVPLAFWKALEGCFAAGAAEPSAGKQRAIFTAVLHWSLWLPLTEWFDCEISSGRCMRVSCIKMRCMLSISCTKMCNWLSGGQARPAPDLLIRLHL